MFMVAMYDVYVGLGNQHKCLLRLFVEKVSKLSLNSTVLKFWLGICTLQA